MNASGLLSGTLRRLRAVWSELRAGGCWPLRSWTCRTRTEGSATVTVLAPPAQPVPGDLPAEIRAALEETRRTGVPDAAMDALLELGRNGVTARVLLRDSTAERNPTLLCVECARKMPRV